jgi:hypothetical protein
MKHILLIIGVSLIIYVAFLAERQASRRRECTLKEVAIVGGCNGSGYCGVRYSDHSYGIEYLPVVGNLKLCKIIKKNRG